MVRHLIEVYRLGVDIEMFDGWTPFMYACMNGWCEIIDYLRGKGAQVDHRDKSGRTAFHWVVKNNHKEALKRLMAFEADPDVLDCDGYLAFDLARSL